jgi:secreted trypsin-like serine protease
MKLPLISILALSLYRGCHAIVSGESAGLDEFPSAAVLYSSTEDDFICGATMITRHAFLTAAHCCKRLKGRSPRVLIGSYDRTDNMEQQYRGAQYIPVSRLVVHPEWNPNTFDNDYCVFGTERRIQTTQYINPARLTSRLAAETGVDVLAVGWGKTSPNANTFSGPLEKADFTVISNTTCNHE